MIVMKFKLLEMYFKKSENYDTKRVMKTAIINFSILED